MQRKIKRIWRDCFGGFELKVKWTDGAKEEGGGPFQYVIIMKIHSKCKYALFTSNFHKLLSKQIRYGENISRWVPVDYSRQSPGRKTARQHILCERSDLHCRHARSPLQTLCGLYCLEELSFLPPLRSSAFCASPYIYLLEATRQFIYFVKVSSWVMRAFLLYSDFLCLCTL